MAYRFTATSSQWMQFGIAPLNGYTVGPITVASLVKVPNFSNDFYQAAVWTSGLGNQFRYWISANQPSFLISGLTRKSTFTMSSTSLWYIAAMTWGGTGTTPRFHLLPAGGSWTHADSTAAITAGVTISATDQLRVAYNSSDTFDIVCVGIKKADSTDGQIIGLTQAAFNDWKAFGFHWLAGFDATGTRTNVANPGSGDETSRNGSPTLVSDPAGWSFASSSTWNGSSTVSLTDTITTAGARSAVTVHGATTTTMAVTVTTASRAATLHGSTAVAETVTVTTAGHTVLPQMTLAPRPLDSLVLAPGSQGSLTLAPRPPGSLVLTPR